jgi:serine/threonine-protein kinase RsbW
VVDLDSYAPIQRELVLELPSDLDSIEHAVEFVMRRCQPCGAGDDRLRLNFRVGLTEALSNAIRYGNGTDPRKRVRMEIEVRECSLTAKITDEGHGFDPHVVPDPTTPQNLMKPGGRGLFLMKKLLDEVRYNDRGNSVTLVLRFTDGPGTRAQA